ncbi:MAG: PEP-CTERM sorting domain-containing protein [Puniceicoccales bacterium]|jgi:hypothetical protein|nr:PEP-CTERM sorting domain-containing protein [Puniceicoccales bacterium]
MKTTTLRTLILIAAATVAPSAAYALTYDGVTLEYHQQTTPYSFSPASSPYYLPTDVQDHSGVTISRIADVTELGPAILIADHKSIDQLYVDGGSGAGYFYVGDTDGPGTLIMQNESIGNFQNLRVGVQTNAEGHFIIDNSYVDIYNELLVGGKSYGEIVIRNKGALTLYHNGNILIGSNSSVNSGSGRMVVDGSSSLLLGRSPRIVVGGTSPGDLVVSAGGTIQGDARTGSVNGINFAGFSTFSVGLDEASMANSLQAPVNVNNVSIGLGAKLSVDTNGHWLTPGDEYLVIQTLGGVSGYFDGLINSVIVTSDTGQIFDVEYRGMNRDVVLIPTANAIPEPSTYALLGGVCALALALLRRRRRKA